MFLWENSDCTRKHACEELVSEAVHSQAIECFIQFDVLNCVTFRRACIRGQSISCAS